MSLRLPVWMALVLGGVGLGLIVGLTAVNLRFTGTAADANSFLPRWAGAHAWLTQGLSPYDPQVSLSAQDRLYGRPANRSQGEDLAVFAHPLPAMLFYAPFGWVDYPAARAAWMTLLELALPLAALLAIRLAGWRQPVGVTVLVVVMSVAWSPGVRAIVAGSAAPLSMLFGLAAVSCVRRRWDVAAGLLLALTLVDPVPGALLTAAVSLWALANRRWMVAAGALGLHVSLVAVSLILLPAWPLDWLRQVATWTGLGAPAGTAPDWPILHPGILPGILLFVLLVSSLWSWRPGREGGTRLLVWSVAFTLVMADGFELTISGRASLVSVLPGLILVLAVLGMKGRGAGTWIVAAAIVVATLTSWLPFALAPAPPIDSVIGAAGGLLITASGLVWVRWWVTRGAGILGLTGETEPYA